ncbi:hypothetical protein D3C75_849050 [compost metagenome]
MAGQNQPVALGDTNVGPIIQLDSRCRTFNHCTAQIVILLCAAGVAGIVTSLARSNEILGCFRRNRRIARIVRERQ